MYGSLWVQYFVWNFKGLLWNFTQNFEPIHCRNRHFTIFYFCVWFTISLKCDIISLSDTGPWYAKSLSVPWFRGDTSFDLTSLNPVNTQQGGEPCIQSWHNWMINIYDLRSKLFLCKSCWFHLLKRDFIGLSINIHLINSLAPGRFKWNLG